MDADEFAARFRETREAIAIELKYSGEQATIRRTLDCDCGLERTALLALLGHCKQVVVKVAAPDDEEVRAADERAKAFLRGLIGEGEQLDVKTLWPARVATSPDEGLAVLDTKDADAGLRLIDGDRSKLGWPA